MMEIMEAPTIDLDKNGQEISNEILRKDALRRKSSKCLFDYYLEGP